MKYAVEATHLRALWEPEEVPEDPKEAGHKLLVYFMKDKTKEGMVYLDYMKEEHLDSEEWDKVLWHSIVHLLWQNPEISRELANLLKNVDSEEYMWLDRYLTSHEDRQDGYMNTFYPFDYPLEKRYTKDPDLFDENTEYRYGVGFVEWYSEEHDTVRLNLKQQIEPRSTKFQEGILEFSIAEFRNFIEDSDVNFAKKHFEIYGDEYTAEIRFFDRVNLDECMDRLPKIPYDTMRYLRASGRISDPDTTYIDKVLNRSIKHDDQTLEKFIEEFKNLSWPEYDILGMMPEEHKAWRNEDISFKDIVKNRVELRKRMGSK